MIPQFLSAASLIERVGERSAFRAPVSPVMNHSLSLSYSPPSSLVPAVCAARRWILPPASPPTARRSYSAVSSPSCFFFFYGRLNFVPPAQTVSALHPQDIETATSSTSPAASPDGVPVVSRVWAPPPRLTVGPGRNRRVPVPAALPRPWEPATHRPQWRLSGRSTCRRLHVVAVSSSSCAGVPVVAQFGRWPCPALRSHHRRHPPCREHSPSFIHLPSLPFPVFQPLTFICIQTPRTFLICG
jgi:hypothetical protein